MAYAQKPDLVFLRNGRVHLNRRGRQCSRLLAAEVCASALVMLDTPCSEVVCRVLATHSIRHFPHHFPSRASQCAISFQLASTSSGVRLTLYPLRRSIWWAPNNASKGQMGINSAFKGLMPVLKAHVLRRATRRPSEQSSTAISCLHLYPQFK